jgi:alpha-beta hydrolase superfamily lysophospholipase
MRHHEGYFQGPRSKQIYYQSWLPDSDPRAILLIVHGIQEHSGRYQNVVDHFTPLGYGVYALDQIGHGRSDGTRAFVDRFEDFMHTISIFVELIQDHNPDTPIFLVGHSMGGLISAAYLLDHQEDFSGAIFSGGMVSIPDFVSAATVTIGKILSVLVPKLGLVRLVPELICTDPKVVEAYINDPLVSLGKSTARLGAELLKGMQRVTAEMDKIKLPIIILHGSDDKLVSPSDGQKLYNTISSPDKTIKIYDGYYHEVFNEPGRDVVFSDVNTWLEKQLS